MSALGSCCLINCKGGLSAPLYDSSLPPLQEAAKGDTVWVLSQELMLKLVREHYPLPSTPGGELEADDSVVLSASQAQARQWS